MKIQKQLSKKRGDKIYHKYVIVLPKKIVKDSSLKEGDELEASAKKGEIKLRKK
ncbi:MAG TPA: AbrB/MazE/SpoVT family DNA-binding domain-containing protein [Candidatus Pacearchaeota archaeon]|nr:spoVT / AbrB like domain protein [archaeon BMS3Abin17]HDK42836.1 AbrB/MazE/SpoVT family DNA-binding domain-containing protein [Candidatus Pacearchaeota archaeon]HDZ60745.1 AbrB/MazE/SpoVT family DNA-binding domain-containing protein [Candidatus Pacearchaeota archaeon]HDZ61282.1 AbrB/MazE/SpoVT family DNA-binding domain-containing protein [Candidatus Pacearchaeota archaeon]